MTSEKPLHMKTIKTFVESLLKYSVLAASPLLVTFVAWLFSLGSFNFLQVMNSEPLTIIVTILSLVSVLISLIEAGMKISNSE